GEPHVTAARGPHVRRSSRSPSGDAREARAYRRSDDTRGAAASHRPAVARQLDGSAVRASVVAAARRRPAHPVQPSRTRRREPDSLSVLSRIRAPLADGRYTLMAAGVLAWWAALEPDAGAAAPGPPGSDALPLPPPDPDGRGLRADRARDDRHLPVVRGGPASLEAVRSHRPADRRTPHVGRRGALSHGVFSAIFFRWARRDEPAI